MQLKEKYCLNCLKQYTPVSRNQKFCQPCREILYPLSIAHANNTKKKDDFNKVSQRVSAKTFLTAGEILLIELGVDHIRLIDKGIEVFARRESVSTNYFDGDVKGFLASIDNRLKEIENYNADTATE